MARGEGKLGDGKSEQGEGVEKREKEEEEGQEGEENRGRFRFVRYERSSECVEVGDSSVSYASAFAVL